jgi:uncharacterized OB-fold protein
MATTDLPLPEVTPLNQIWWDGLAQGRLMLPSCACGHRWLPVSPECPACLHAGRWQWVAARGEGTVVSWVVYHTAYHPAFKDRLPYNVAIVELAEGPRLITNIVAPLGDIRIGLAVRLTPGQEQGVTIARFAPA